VRAFTRVMQLATEASSMWFVWERNLLAPK